MKLKINSIIYSLFLVILLGLVSSCSTFTKEEKIKIDKIDSLVNHYTDMGIFNGCLLVVYDHKVIYSKAIGLAICETGEPLTSDHSFRLASLTKSLTGVAIMILKEQGKLDFDDDVKDFLPDLPYEGVTIRHLLNHTSGLPNYIDLVDKYWDTLHINSADRKVVNNYDVYEMLVDYPPPVLFQPGDGYRYCNTGYSLLALIIERVSGNTYHEFMKRYVFDPLEMDNAYVNAIDGKLPESKRAVGFGISMEDGSCVEHDWNYQNGLFGDGGILASVNDLYKYDQALYTEKLVSNETLMEAFSVSGLNNGDEVEYGFGWSVIPDERGTFIAHSGAWLGYRSFFLRDYKNGNTVIQLCNTVGIRRGQLGFPIYEILHE